MSLLDLPQGIINILFEFLCCDYKGILPLYHLLYKRIKKDGKVYLQKPLKIKVKIVCHSLLNIEHMRKLTTNKRMIFYADLFKNISLIDIDYINEIYYNSMNKYIMSYMNNIKRINVTNTSYIQEILSMEYFRNKVLKDGIRFIIKLDNGYYNFNGLDIAIYNNYGHIVDYDKNIKINLAAIPYKHPIYEILREVPRNYKVSAKVDQIYKTSQIPQQLMINKLYCDCKMDFDREINAEWIVFGRYIDKASAMKNYKNIKSKKIEISNITLNLNVVCRLTHIEVLYISTYFNSFPNIDKLNNLHTLKIDNTHNRYTIDISKLCNHPSLKTLYLVGCRFNGIEKLTNLEYLELHVSHDIYGVDLTKLIKLKHIYIINRLVTPNFILKLPEKDNLKVELKGMFKIDNKVINFPTLTQYRQN